MANLDNLHKAEASNRENGNYNLFHDLFDSPRKNVDQNQISYMDRCCQWQAEVRVLYIWNYNFIPVSFHPLVFLSFFDWLIDEVGVWLTKFLGYWTIDWLIDSFIHSLGIFHFWKYLMVGKILMCLDVNCGFRFVL